MLNFVDIVFCRTWYRVEVPKLYNPLTSLLLPPEEKNRWQGMKTVGQLKREKGIRSEPAIDSLYTVCIMVCYVNLLGDYKYSNEGCGDSVAGQLRYLSRTKCG